MTDSELSATARIVAFVEGYRDRPASFTLTELDELSAAIPLFPPDPMRGAARVVAMTLENRPRDALDLAIKLAGSEEPATRALAAGMVTRLAQFQPAIWKEFARMLCADSVWEVRLHAATIFDTAGPGEGAAEYHPEFVFDLIAEWTRDKEYFVRHAATQALLSWAVHHTDQTPRLLALLEPLFNDPIEYVRAGSVLALRTVGRKRPELVLSFIELQLDSLGEFEAETYLTALEDRFTQAHADWKARLIHGLHQAPPAPSANIE